LNIDFDYLTKHRLSHYAFWDDVGKNSIPKNFVVSALLK